MADCPIPSPVTYLPFGTATSDRSTSEASRRGEGGLLDGLRHGDLAHRYLRAILAWRSIT